MMPERYELFKRLTDGEIRILATQCVGAEMSMTIVKNWTAYNVGRFLYYLIKKMKEDGTSKSAIDATVLDLCGYKRTAFTDRV